MRRNVVSGVGCIVERLAAVAAFAVVLGLAPSCGSERAPSWRERDPVAVWRSGLSPTPPSGLATLAERMSSELTPAEMASLAALDWRTIDVAAALHDPVLLRGSAAVARVLDEDPTFLARAMELLGPGVARAQCSAAAGSLAAKIVQVWATARSRSPPGRA